MIDYKQIHRLSEISKKNRETLQNLKNMSTNLDTMHYGLIEKLSQQKEEIHILQQENTRIADIYGNIIKSCPDIF
jgi:hypothetical protein